MCHLAPLPLRSKLSHTCFGKIVRWTLIPMASLTRGATFSSTSRNPCGRRPVEPTRGANGLEEKVLRTLVRGKPTLVQKRRTKDLRPALLPSREGCKTCVGKDSLCFVHCCVPSSKTMPPRFSGLFRSMAQILWWTGVVYHLSDQMLVEQRFARLHLLLGHDRWPWNFFVHIEQFCRASTEGLLPETPFAGLRALCRSAVRLPKMRVSAVFGLHSNQPSLTDYHGLASRVLAFHLRFGSLVQRGLLSRLTSSCGHTRSFTTTFCLHEQHNRDAHQARAVCGSSPNPRPDSTRGHLGMFPKAHNDGMIHDRELLDVPNPPWTNYFAT